jgi:hypothetical protein
LVEEVYDFALAGASDVIRPDRLPPLVIPGALCDNAFFTYHAVPRILHPEHPYRKSRRLTTKFLLGAAG